jgi:hypothetical protein
MLGYKSRTLTVYREPHHRKSYIKDVKPGPGVRLKRIPATHVKGSRFEIRDVGAPGRGPKLIKIKRPNLMTREARSIGLLKEGERIGDLSHSEIETLADHLRRKYGERRARGMFASQLGFRKRQADGFKSLMRHGFDSAGGKPGVWD